MNFDCTTSKYDALYARWLVGADALLKLGGYDPEKDSLLDLCGGTGAVSKAALEMGAKRVWLADKRPRVADPRIVRLACAAEYIDTISGAVESDFSFVVCRQAIGYLNLPVVASALLEVMTDGGVFVFNSFKRPKWGARGYWHGGRPFFEASAYFGQKVFHVQAGLNGVDVTAFRWWADAEIVKSFQWGSGRRGLRWELAEKKESEKSAWWKFVARGS